MKRMIRAMLPTLTSLLVCLSGGARAGEFVVYASPLGEYMIRIGPTLAASTGLMMEICAGAFTMAGVPVRVAPEMPWSRAQATAADEPGGIVVLLARTPAREEQWRWLSMVYTDRVYAYTMQGQPVYTGYADIAAKKPRVGVKLGTASESILKGLGVPVEAVVNAEQNFLKLMSGRLDVVVLQGMAVPQAIEAALSLPGGESFKGRTEALRRTYYEDIPLWVATSRRTPEADARRLEEALEMFKGTKEYSRIVSRYEERLARIGR